MNNSDWLPLGHKWHRTKRGHWVSYATTKKKDAVSHFIIPGSPKFVLPDAISKDLHSDIRLEVRTNDVGDLEYRVTPI